MVNTKEIEEDKIFTKCLIDEISMLRDEFIDVNFKAKQLKEKLEDITINEENKEEYIEELYNLTIKSIELKEKFNRRLTILELKNIYV